eukprot:1181257-Prymnesium_polylepis.1
MAVPGPQPAACAHPAHTYHQRRHPTPPVHHTPPPQRQPTHSPIANPPRTSRMHQHPRTNTAPNGVAHG